MSFRICLVLGLMALVPAPAWSQRKEVIVLFKDGFRLEGKVVEKREVISEGGTSVSIPASGAFGLYIDNDVRRIYFSASQGLDVIPKKAEEVKEMMVLRRGEVGAPTERPLGGWEFESVTPWNSKWERTITFSTGRGRLDIDQRLTLLTPFNARIGTLRYAWEQNFLTQELGPPLVRSLLFKYYGDRKELKEPEKRLLIARFFYQAGWYDLANQELEVMIKEFRNQEKAAEPLLDKVKKAKANWFFDQLEQARQVGQFTIVSDYLDALDRDPEMVERLNDKNRVLAQDIKNQMKASKEKVALTKNALKELAGLIPKSKAYWTGIADRLGKEINFDTMDRLETFTTFAQQHLREVKEKRKPTQKVEEVLALAVTGWLQGNSAADPDVKLATQLWSARTLILDLQKTESPIVRKQMAESLAKEAKDVPIDMLARLIKMLPPPNPFDKVDTEVHKIDIEVPDGASGTYHLQLPPDYHPYRSYPVLMLLHGAREKSTEMMARMTEMAAHHGYILAAPNWGKGLTPSYAYSAQERAIVLDTLRDLRRRFQIDSDRVFLFGWEQGGEAAYDIALAHPDQFAGVLPMNGKPQAFSLKCHTNGQYLPFYVVDGDQNGNTVRGTRKIFQDWVRWHYPSIYVEYKGRGSEWYAAEWPSMFDWMNRKKRRQPLKELGRPNNAGFSGEEFRTMRSGENKFYWVAIDGINDRNLNDHKAWDPKIFPATVTASVHTGNELVLKGGGKDANIWNQINLKTSGARGATLWLAPNLIDFAKPLTVRINGANALTNKMITPSVPLMLEEFFHQGDRQRLFYQRLEFKL